MNTDVETDLSEAIGIEDAAMDSLGAAGTAERGLALPALTAGAPAGQTPAILPGQEAMA